MHKVGTILVNSIDSVIISGFIGVVVLGYFVGMPLVQSLI